MQEPIFIVDGARTPFLKSRNRPGPFSAADLATQAGRALLMRQKFDPPLLDEVILGCAAPSPDEVNIGRLVALRMGCGQKVPGWTVMRNCASGMQALDSAINNIRAGRSNLVLAGGVDALSRAPLLFSDAMVLWLSSWYAAKSLGQRAALVTQFRPGFLAPVIGLMKGLTDPMVGLLMGQTAENLAYRFHISRREMDEFSARSHQRVLAAQKAGHFADEIVPLFDNDGKLYAADDGVREDSTADNLAKLKPFFDRKYGNVTAGNSSQITDGAAWLVLASERAVAKFGLEPIARIADSEWAGLDPAEMGLGPVQSATPLLLRNGLGLNDLDTWEINEAFAAQVIGCLRAWASDDYCREFLGLPHAMGVLDEIEAQCRRRRDRARPSGRRVRRAHRAARLQRPQAHGRHPRDGVDLHRRRAGRCDAGRTRGALTMATVPVEVASVPQRVPGVPGATPLRNWKITRDADGLAWLAFDKADSSTNTLSAAVLAELNQALDILDRDPPKGLVVHSGKPNGFIAGADVDEFGEVRDAAAAREIVRRGWDTFERLAKVAYPTLALIKGFCLGGGLELALACRYRVVVDDPSTRLGLPEVMLGIVPGWGGIKRLPRLIGAPAALDLLLSGRTVDARKARKLGLADEMVPVRIMNLTAAGVLRARPAPRSLPFPLSLTLTSPGRKIIASQARKQVARRARRNTIRRPTPSSNCSRATTAMHWLRPRAIGHRSLRFYPRRLLPTCCACSSCRSASSRWARKTDGKVAHVHVVGAGTMGGDIAAWCALRGLTVTLQDQNAERLAPAMQRAGKLFRDRLKDARRARDARIDSSPTSRATAWRVPT